MNRWKYIYFFDKNGKYYNFDYNEDNDIWLGNIYLKEVSVDLFEVGQLFILQKFVEKSSSSLLFGYPHSYEPGPGTIELLGESNCNWSVNWETDDPQDIFLFQFDNDNVVKGINMNNKANPILQKYEDIEIPLRYDPSQTINNEGYVVTDLIRHQAIQINFAISSSEENTFKRTLIITDNCSGSIVAKLTVYGETVSEDERLKVMTENLGYAITANDSVIFKDTDVKEHLPNFIEINSKRKEIMLEGHNIYPYIGSYKGLINAIKFFGYNNLQIKEFWKNINKSSTKFGKYIHSNPINIFNSKIEYNDNSITLPNKNFKKTNMFSLIYKINKVKQGVYDFQNLPLTEDSFDFTIEEVLIKLFGLKKKLEKEFLPLNAHISDIIGEADFFGSTSITNTLSRNDKRNINVGTEADFNVFPKDCIELRDLRTFLSFCFREEAIVGSAVVDFCNAFINPVNVSLSGPETSRNLLMGPYEEGDLLPKPPIGPDVNSILGKPIGGQLFTVSDIADVYLSYFSRYAPNQNPENAEIEGKSSLNLPDSPNIPVGALAVLSNNSFDNVTWDNVNLTYVQLSTINNIQTFDLNPQGAFLGDTFKINDPITGTEVSYEFSTGDTQETIVDSLVSQLQSFKDNLILPWIHFDISKVNLPIYGYAVRIFGSDTERILLNVDKGLLSGAVFNKISNSNDLLYRWDNIGNSDFIEIEWTVFKEKTDVSSEFFYSVKGPIKQYNSLPITLPFIGTYTVQMKLYDLYNNASSIVKTDFICVEPKEVEYSGWYQSRKEKYTWREEGKWKWKDYGSSWDLPIEPSVTWDDEVPSLYESLDRVNAILNNFGLGVSPDFTLLNFQDNGNLSFSGPYFWDNLDNASWCDTYHLWWDMTSITGDTPAFFQFKEIEQNSYLTITDLKGNVGSFYFDNTINTLAKAVSMLNLSNDPIISKYIYNIVYDATENEKFVQGVSRYFGAYGDWKNIDILDKDGEIVCESTGFICNSLIYRQGLHQSSNPLWSTAKFINDGLTLPKLTWAMFVYDKCKIKGKDKPIWTIKNTSDSTVPNIYFESKYLTYLFKKPGKYEIGLELTDSNGNKYKKDRNILIIK